MDSGEILYNFDLNNSSLDEITKHVNDIRSAGQDIEAMFNRLAEWYQGAGSDGLMARKAEHSEHAGSGERHGHQHPATCDGTAGIHERAR